jgi:hypothetical protein
LSFPGAASQFSLDGQLFSVHSAPIVSLEHAPGPVGHFFHATAGADDAAARELKPEILGNLVLINTT